MYGCICDHTISVFRNAVVSKLLFAYYSIELVKEISVASNK